MAGMTDRMGTPDARGIAERLASVRGRIAAAAELAGRDPASVRLIAVTKTVPPERIAEAVFAAVLGHQFDFGANQVGFGGDDREIGHEGLAGDGAGRGAVDQHGVGAAAAVGAGEAEAG